MEVAFVAPEEDPQDWLPGLRAALPSARFHLWPEIPDSAAIDVALVAKPPAGSLSRFRGLKLIQSLWMGVDGLLADPTLPRGVPIARVIDPGMLAAMSETVLARVLDWHRDLYRYRTQQRARLWRQLPQRLASDRRVGLLGLGELGRQAAQRLLQLGFRVCGWSRRQKKIDRIECHSGAGGLDALAAKCGALVCLLPLTAETRGILNARLFARLPAGACVVNVARGAHLVEADLLAALDSGRLAHAYLDVFETEPLPETHPFWSHSGISLTPHVAALTEPRTALPLVIRNLERAQRGEAPEAQVDPAAGY
jgi:glyoxylate/hydroxypyruvate reductase A